MARDARAAVRARVPALRRRDPRARACTSRSTPTRRGCSGSCASCPTRPASGAGWRSGSAGAACPSLEGALRELAARAGPRRAAGGDRRAAATWRSSGWSTSSPTPRGRAATGRRSSGRRWRCVLGDGAGRDDDRRPLAGGGASRVGAARDRSGRCRRARASGATSRAWFEELRLAPAVADALRGRGLDEAAAWGPPSVCGCCWTCRCRRRSAASADGLPLRLVDVWLADPVVRSFLRINRWDDADWFHRESWLELLAWTDRLERVLTPPEARVRRPVERSVLVRRLAEAGEASGYRVDGLREALASGATAASPAAGPDLAPAEGHRPAARPEGRADPTRRGRRPARTGRPAARPGRAV